MKKLAALLLALAMVLALAACGGQNNTPSTGGNTPSNNATNTPSNSGGGSDGSKVGQTVLKCAFNQTITNPEAQTLLKISDDLYDATDGRYSLEVYPDASLGDQAQTLENVMIGALDMSLVGNAIIEPYASDFGIIATPYVYDSIEHQQKVFESGDPALQALYDTTEQYGFTVLCAYSLGARNLYTRDHAVSTPDDLKGMKIRVIGSDTSLNMMNNMGGVGVAMAQGDVYSAIQTGTLDGAENNIITYVDLLQYEVAPYYNYSGHLLLPDELVISKQVLDKMSAEDQAALRKVCADSIPYCFQLCDALRSDYQAQAEAKGVTFTDADIPAFQALCADQIQEVANRNSVTKGVYDLIVSLR